MDDSPRARVLRFALLAVLLAPGATARGDDWLALLPPCALPHASRPELSLLYPRPGLPALVAAGGTLVLRVRVPAALTPPPGVQQEGALRPWTAAVQGHALPLGAEGRELAYELPVVDVRPDGASSLVYRVSVTLPAYAAPGTYTLALRTPFGERRAELGVRVLARGQPARAALLPPELALLPLSARAGLPVDAWLIADAPTSHAAVPAPPAEGSVLARVAPAPLLDLTAGGFVVRVREALVHARGPACAQSASYDLALRELRASTRLPLLAAHDLDLASPPEAFTRAASFASAPPPVVVLGPSSVSASVAEGAPERELLLLLPIEQRLAAGPEATLFPAARATERRPRAIVALLRARPGTTARVSLAGPAGPADYVLSPSRARVAEPVRLVVRGAAPSARVAFELGFARTAFGSPELTTSFAAPQVVPLAALVLPATGGARAVRGELLVRPASRAPSCSVGARAVGAGPPLPLCAVLALLKRRAARRRGISSGRGGVVRR